MAYLSCPISLKDFLRKEKERPPFVRQGHLFRGIIFCVEAIKNMMHHKSYTHLLAIRICIETATFQSCDILLTGSHPKENVMCLTAGHPRCGCTDFERISIISLAQQWISMGAMRSSNSWYKYHNNPKCRFSQNKLPLSNSSEQTLATIQRQDL